VGVLLTTNIQGKRYKIEKEMKKENKTKRENEETEKAED